VPYYRAYWSSQRRQGNVASWAILDNWPILEKQSVRANPLAFIADDCNPKQMYHEHTSGTTGTPLNLWWSKQTVREWFALIEARLRHWHDVSYHDRWAILGGQLVAEHSRAKPPFWVWNAGLKQLYLSAYHLSESSVAAYGEALTQHNVSYLLGYPSGMSYIARVALEKGVALPKLKFVMSNAEPLYSSQREVLSKAFSCPVYDSYGMAEIVAAGSECKAGSMHQWPEVGLTEIWQDDENVPVHGEAFGRIIATGLLNLDMPLIRYNVGDHGALYNNAACNCGRTLPQWKGIEGRSDDEIVSSDGRHIGRLDPIFKSELPIIEAQIIQEAPNVLRIKIVPTDEFSATSEQLLLRLVKSRVGDMHVVVEKVATIPRTNNGKFRAVISLEKDSLE
jgi:phenylacetate-CoA ligase